MGERVVNAREIAARHGVSQNTVYAWLRRYTDFPKPYDTISGGHRVWATKAVDAWVDRHRKRQEAKA